MTISAMVELKKGFKQLNQQFIPSDWDEALEKHYEKEFFPKLTANIPGDLKFGTFRPSGQAARYLQRYYIVTNPNPVGEKDKLLAAEDGSDYSKFHVVLHCIRDRAVGSQNCCWQVPNIPFGECQLLDS